MKTVIAVAAAVVLSAGASFAADRTWTGTLTDTMCPQSHQSNIEHAQQNSGRKMTDQECAVGCVMRRDQRYVLVAGGKTYQIENQDYAGLAEHAAHVVTVTGTLGKDASIRVAKISPANAGKGH